MIGSCNAERMPFLGGAVYAMSKAGLVGLTKGLARDLGEGSTVVTILCDYGARYASKIYNPAFLASKGLPTPPWMTPGR